MGFLGFLAAVAKEKRQLTRHTAGQLQYYREEMPSVEPKMESLPSLALWSLDCREGCSPVRSASRATREERNGWGQ